VLTLMASKRKRHALNACALAIFWGFIGARLTYCAVNYPSYILRNQLDIFRIYDGGYSLWGGLFVLVAAVNVYCKRHRLLTGEMLDGMAPGLTLFIFIERFAEAITSQGVGKLITSEKLASISALTLEGQWGACFNVRLYEAAIALIVFIVTVCAMKGIRHKRQGELFCLSAALISGFQVVLESLRDDDYIRITFVRISQCLAMLTLLILLFRYFIGIKKPQKKHVTKDASFCRWLCLLLSFASIGVCAWMERMVDSAENKMELHYLIMLAAVLVLIGSILTLRKRYMGVNGHIKPRKSKRAGITGSIVLLAAMLVVVSVFVISGGKVNALENKTELALLKPSVQNDVTSDEPEATLEVTAAFTATATPEITATPEVTASPEVTAIPTESDSFEVTAAVTEAISTEATAVATNEATATPEVTATPEATATPEVTATPEATATVVPVAIAALPMDNFDGGSVLDGSCLTKDTYQDETITVKYSRERLSYKYNGSNYNSWVNFAEVTIVSPCQLRTAIAGTTTSAHTGLLLKMSQKLNAVVAVNGDYYSNRTANTYEVRQSQVISEETADGMDMLIIDYDGNFHIFTAEEADEGYAAMKGNIYQCFTFGPALIVDGEITYTENVSSAFPYFGAWAVNPRTAIGQIDELHYLLVMVEGRNSQSCGVACAELAQMMYERGCVQAFNLDGGATSGMYFGTKRVSDVTKTGLRNVSDIVYFASAAQ